MYWLYSLGVMLIMLTLVDIVYFLQKKYTEYVTKKSGQERTFKYIIHYLGTFILGCLFRIIVMDKSVGFLILLKDTFLFGLLAVLIIVNIIVVKNRLSVTKSEIIKLKDIEKSDGEKLFSDKKDKKDDNE